MELQVKAISQGFEKNLKIKSYYIIKKYCTSKRNTQRFGSAK